MTIILNEISSTQITVTIDGVTETFDKSAVTVSYSGSNVLFVGTNTDAVARDYSWTYTDVVTPIPTVGAEEVAYTIEKLCEVVSGGGGAASNPGLAVFETLSTNFENTNLDLTAIADDTTDVIIIADDTKDVVLITIPSNRYLTLRSDGGNPINFTVDDVGENYTINGGTGFSLDEKKNVRIIKIGSIIYIDNLNI